MDATTDSAREARRASATRGCSRALALLLDPLRHAQQAQAGDEADVAHQVAEQRPAQGDQCGADAEVGPGEERPHHEERVEDAVEELATGQECAEQDRGHQLDADVGGGMVHARHQGDHRTGQDGQGAAASVDVELGVVRADLDRGRLEVGPGDEHDPHDQRTAHEVGEQGDDPQPGEPDQRAAAGDDRRHRHEEVLGEELAAREQERHEADREREPGRIVSPVCSLTIR